MTKIKRKQWWEHFEAQNAIDFPCFGVGPVGTDINITNTWLSKL